MQPSCARHGTGGQDPRQLRREEPSLVVTSAQPSCQSKPRVVTTTAAPLPPKKFLQGFPPNSECWRGEPPETKRCGRGCGGRKTGIGAGVNVGDGVGVGEIRFEARAKKVEPELERRGTMWVGFGDGDRIGWRSMQRWNKSWG